jgi:hypothetical protein
LEFSKKQIKYKNYIIIKVNKRSMLFTMVNLILK